MVDGGKLLQRLEARDERSEGVDDIGGNGEGGGQPHGEPSLSGGCADEERNRPVGDAEEHRSRRACPEVCGRDLRAPWW